MAAKKDQARTGQALLTVTLEAVAYALYVLAVLYVIAVIARVAMIGKPRKPITRGEAIGSVVYSGRGNHIGDRGKAPWLVPHQATTEPLPRRTIRTRRRPSSSSISRTRRRSLTDPSRRPAPPGEVLTQTARRAYVACYGTRPAP